MEEELPVPVGVKFLTGLQFLAITFSVNLVGAILKPLRENPLLPPLPEVFATRFTDHGIWLVLLPISWLIWAVFATNRPITEYRTEPRSFYFVGYAILTLAIALGIVGTFSALSLLGAYPSTVTP